MGTRSNIIVKVKKKDIGRVLTHEFKGKTYETKIEKNYIGIYCHWDGYPSGVGSELFEKYNDYEKILQLISGGYISSISDEPNYYMGWDRDEEWEYNNPEQSDKPKVCCGWTEYAYIFKNKKWYVGIVVYDKKTDTDKIKNVVELTPEVIEKGHPKYWE